MHILYIHQHFATPKGTTGTRSYEFARRWVQAGHKVTLITGYYDIGGLDISETHGRKQTIDGINIVIVGTKYSNKQSYVRRIFSFLSFCILSIYAGLRTKKIDIIYATSTPLTVGIPAVILKWFKCKPFVFEVRDQWPEIPIELGIIKSKIMIRVLLWLEKTIYKYSSAIVALSPGMADGIKKVLTCEKSITTVPNCCDLEVFNPDINDTRIREKYGWADKLVFLHFGAMGKVNNLEFVINAAEKLSDDNNIHFVVAGDGSERQNLIKKVEQLKLTNLEILDSRPKADLAELVAACDISMVVIAGFPVLENNSSNKFFDSLSAGKPVLLNYSGWQRKVLEDNNAGYGCDLCTLDQFIEKVLYFKEHKDQIKQMCKNARQIAEKEYSRDRLAGLVLSALEENV